MEMKKLDAGELEAVVGGTISANEKEKAREKVNSLPFFENPACKYANGPHSGGETVPYTIIANDNLSGISLRFLGSASHYPILATANGIEDPNVIIVGNKIRFRF